MGYINQQLQLIKIIILNMLGGYIQINKKTKKQLNHQEYLGKVHRRENPLKVKFSALYHFQEEDLIMLNASREGQTYLVEYRKDTLARIRQGWYIEEAWNSDNEKFLTIREVKDLTMPKAQNQSYKYYYKGQDPEIEKRINTDVLAHIIEEIGWNLQKQYINEDC